MSRGEPTDDGDTFGTGERIADGTESADPFCGNGTGAAFGDHEPLDLRGCGRRRFLRALAAAGGGLAGLRAAVERVHGDDVPDGRPVVWTRDRRGRPERLRMVGKERHRRLSVYRTLDVATLRDRHAGVDGVGLAASGPDDGLALRVVVDRHGWSARRSLPSRVRRVPVVLAERDPAEPPGCDTLCEEHVTRFYDPLPAGVQVKGRHLGSVTRDGTLGLVAWNDDPRDAYECLVTAHHVVALEEDAGAKRMDEVVSEPPERVAVAEVEPEPGGRRSESVARRKSKPPANSESKPPANSESKPPAGSKSKPPAKRKSKPTADKRSKPPAKRKSKPTTEKRSKPTAERRSESVVQGNSEPTERRSEPPTERDVGAETEPGPTVTGTAEHLFQSGFDGGVPRAETVGRLRAASPLGPTGLDVAKYEVTDAVTAAPLASAGDQPRVTGSWDFAGLADATAAPDDAVPVSFSGRSTCWAESRCTRTERDHVVQYEAVVDPAVADAGDSGGPWLDPDGKLVCTLATGPACDGIVDHHGPVGTALLDRLGVSLHPPSVDWR